MTKLGITRKLKTLGNYSKSFSNWKKEKVQDKRIKEEVQQENLGIINFVRRENGERELTIEDYEKAYNDPIAGDFLKFLLGKSVEKQTFRENAFSKKCEEVIKIEKYDNLIFEKLPNHGKNSISLINGKPVKNASLNLKRDEALCKNIDFILRNNATGITCYISHKASEDNGGTQTDQWNEQRNFVRQGLLSKNDKDVFIAVCDNLTKLSNSKSSNQTLESLRKECASNKNVIVCTSEELLNDIFLQLNNN